jgi:hypothetical protein
MKANEIYVRRFSYKFPLFLCILTKINILLKVPNKKLYASPSGGRRVLPCEADRPKDKRTNRRTNMARLLAAVRNRLPNELKNGKESSDSVKAEKFLEAEDFFCQSLSFAYIISLEFCCNADHTTYIQQTCIQKNILSFSL